MGAASRASASGTNRGMVASGESVAVASSTGADGLWTGVIGVSGGVAGASRVSFTSGGERALGEASVSDTEVAAAVGDVSFRVAALLDTGATSSVGRTLATKQGLHDGASPPGRRVDSKSRHWSWPGEQEAVIGPFQSSWTQSWAGWQACQGSGCGTESQTRGSRSRP